MQDVTFTNCVLMKVWLSNFVVKVRQINKSPTCCQLYHICCGLMWSFVTLSFFQPSMKFAHVPGVYTCYKVLNITPTQILEHTQCTLSCHKKLLFSWRLISQHKVKMCKRIIHCMLKWWLNRKSKLSALHLTQKEYYCSWGRTRVYYRPQST